MLIQVPLVQPQRPRRSIAPCAPASMALGGMAMARCRSNVDEAVIGHGELEGPFTEIDGLAIQRDARFPIRVTVQFYKATSHGVVAGTDIRALADQIDSVYADAKAIGSLVVEADRGRSTEWDDGGAGKAPPADWWETFWATQEAATGKTRDQLRRELEIVLGRKPNPSELEDAIRRVFGTPST
jgi:hypothetical protein